VAFNLYFAGTQCKEADLYIEEHGCLRLLSYLNDKNHIKNRVDKGMKTFVDSGAFSAHTKGKVVDVEDYINYVNERTEFVTIFAQLDKIPGDFGKPKTTQQLMEAPILSWQNYLYMRDRVAEPDKLLPIFHQGEDFSYLEKMLETTFNGRHIPYIGLSPANDMATIRKEAYLKKCFEIIKASSNPTVKTHAFGMTSLKLLEKYPLYSADSTSWIMTAANGSIMTKWGVMEISNNQKVHKKHIFHKTQQEQDIVRAELLKFGIDYDEAMVDYKVRMICNIKFLQNWADNYVYKPIVDKQSKLF